MKEKYLIAGMRCAACSAKVEHNISMIEGVKEASVNLLANSMTVEYEDTLVTVNDIITTVEKLGFEATLVDDKKNKKSSQVEDAQSIAEKSLKKMKHRVIISFIFCIPLFYIAMGDMLGWPMPSFLLGAENAMSFSLTLFLLIIPIIYVNSIYYKVGFPSLFRRNPNMDSLIAVATSAAVLYGIYAMYRIGYALGHDQIHIAEKFAGDLFFDGAAIVLTFITAGKYFEQRAKMKTGDAIKKLVDLSPKTALVERNGREVEILAEDLLIGDIAIIKPGSVIPSDGAVVEGTSSIDESMLTGESMPVAKAQGDNVYGASINKAGFMKIKILKTGEDTALSQIIKLVEEASSSKAPIANIADRISGVFVPIVMSISIIAFIVWIIMGSTFEFAFSIAIAILVVSCPCALGLATPTAIMVGTGKGAQNGILIKSGECLETAGKIDTIVLDKTGTITEGKPKVTDIFITENSKINEDDLLKLVASCEKKSEHILADAILEEAAARKIDTVDIENFQAYQGKGISASIDSHKIFIGNAGLLEENGIPSNGLYEKAKDFASQGKTALYIAIDNLASAVIAIADTIKPSSYEAIESLKEMGLEIVMLTGDSRITAQAIKNKLGIDTAIAEVLPDEKDSHIQALQNKGKKVGMVGDGINDAPALTRSDVGIAIGSGTDVAIESADIVLIRDDLNDVATSIELSKDTILKIKEGLAWALVYNGVMIPIAAGIFFHSFGLKLNPMLGGAFMGLSSVTVVLNSLRLNFFKPKHKRSK